MSRSRLLCSSLGLTAVLFASSAAAQTVSGVNFTNPLRFVGSQAPVLSTRPTNLNPFGISYADCASDMTLQFALGVSGFPDNGTHVEVWASHPPNTCAGLADRGLIAGQSPVCWAVAPSVDPGGASGQQSFNVRVQDLVGWQNAPPTDPSQPTPMGAAACTAQPDYNAVPLVIDFVPMDASHNAVGQLYQFSITTDLVGPPAPQNLCETAGETVLRMTWNANTDGDTIGYDFFIDPPPGLLAPDASVAYAAGAVTECNDGGCYAVQSGSTLVSDSGCGLNATCNDPTLTKAIVPDAGASTYPEAGTTTSDGGDAGGEGGEVDGGAGASDAGAGMDASDAGSASDAGGDGASEAGDAATDAGTVVVADAGDAGDAGDAEVEGGEVGPGGIAIISSVYLFDDASVTIPDKTTSSFTMNGLVDNVVYTVVVAAVDGTGNIGPPSSEVCDYPATVSDFWQTYESDGGGTASYCALDRIGVGGTSLAGVGCAVAVAAIARRRRRRRRAS